MIPRILVVAILACFVPWMPAKAEGDSFPAPPKGYDQKRDVIPHGKLETIEYESSTVGANAATGSA